MMISEIKIHVDQENKKVHISGDVSLKAILALLEGLDENPADYVIGEIELNSDYPIFPDYPQPWVQPYQSWPPQDGITYYTDTCGNSITYEFKDGVMTIINEETDVMTVTQEEDTSTHNID